MALTREENDYWREYGYHRGETVLKNLPAVFAIESTNYCNLKCIMCPRGEPDLMRRSLGHMDTALFEKILVDATFFTQPCWFHWFGEPLMNPRLFEQVAIAKRKVPNLGISTNATLLNEDNARRILDSGLDTIMLAIDGATKAVYERVRKSSFDFEDVCANAERFLALKRRLGRTKPHAILSIIVMNETAADLAAFRQRWEAQGADEVIFKPYANWAGQDPLFVELARVADRPAIATPRPHPCKFLWESVVISWDGRVVPCCFDFDAKLVLGDLKRQSLAEVWNSPAYVHLRRAELDGRNDTDLCLNCSQAPGHARDPNWGLIPVDSIVGLAAAPGI